MSDLNIFKLCVCVGAGDVGLEAGTGHRARGVCGYESPTLTWVLGISSKSNKHF